LYDQFSGGRTDPAAIRNFLRAAFLNWRPRPVFVTLLGDASFDFKNYKTRAAPGQPGTLLPSYENGFDSAVDRQYSSDDWLLNVDSVYVYLHTYPDGPGDTKPGAKADIKSNINQGGVAVVNFIGHGGPTEMADEGVFLDTDVGTLTNAGRLPLVVAASCDVGK